MKTYRLFLTVAVLMVAIVVTPVFSMGKNDVTKAEAAKVIAKLESKEFTDRAEAVNKLGEYCCKESIEALLSVMKNDCAPRCRMMAAMALLKIGDPSVIPEIKKAAKKDPHQTVRNTLRGVLLEFEKLETQLAQKPNK